MSRIFISYKRVDKDKVFKIKDQIETTLGEKCWIDLDGIESDAQFKNIIIKAINDCEIVLFMYSKAHSKIVDFEKDWTVRELHFASKKNKRIVFINIDGSPLTDEFEFDYGTKQQVDATSEDAVVKLGEDLRGWLKITDLKSPLNDIQWNDFVDAVLKGEVIPIIGSDIIELGGKPINQTLLNVFEKACSINTGMYSSFSQLISDDRFKDEFGDNDIKTLIYDNLDNIITTYTQNDDNRILRKLLSLKCFPFIITTSFTPIVEQIMRNIWGEDLRVMKYCNDSLRDDDILTHIDLIRPTVYYLFGKLDLFSRRWVLTDQEMMEFCMSLQNLFYHGPVKLKDCLNKAKYLFYIGNDYIDGQFRFLWYALRDSSITGQKALVVHEKIDHNLFHFLESMNSYIESDSQYVVEVLEERYREKININMAEDLYREGMIDFNHPACEGEKKRAYCLIRKAAYMGLPQAREMILDDTKFDFDTDSVWKSYLSSIENMKRKEE